MHSGYLPKWKLTKGAGGERVFLGWVIEMGESSAEIDLERRGIGVGKGQADH